MSLHREVRSEIDDNALSLLAGTIYAGIPAVIIWHALSRPAWRPKAVSVLGSITPLSCVFLYLTIDFALHQRVGEDAFAFYAMWIMSAGAYGVSLIAGIGLAFVPWPRALVARFVASAGFVLGLHFAMVSVGE